jgi:transmembrane sensor
MENQNQIDLIIYKFLVGSASEEESEKLSEWLTESSENRLYYFTIKRIWLEGKEIPKMEEVLDASWRRLKLRTAIQSSYKSRDTVSTKFNLKKFSVAATILILVGISSFLGIRQKTLVEFQKNSHEILVPLGSRTRVILPDGTEVWLNADSKLNYGSDFGIRNREVSLIGEAYFNVQKHSSSTFTVKTRDLNVRALGTEFNVKAYPDEDVTETTLVSGRVEVIITDEGINARPVLLKNDQRIIYSRAQVQKVTYAFEDEDDEIIMETTDITVEELYQRPKLHVSHINSVEEFTAWKDGRLVFRAESLGNLARKLERFYNVDIYFEDESIKDIRYSGALDEVTIEEVLRAIQISSNLAFRIEKNRVVVSYRK